MKTETWVMSLVRSLVVRRSAVRYQAGFRAKRGRRSVKPPWIALIGLGLLSEPAVGWAQQLGDFTYTNDANAVTITGYTGTDDTVIIPSTINGLPVTAVGNSAFSSCSSVTNLTIPDSVTNLMDQAFAECGNLVSVVNGSGITRIGHSAFNADVSLTGFTLPNGVTTIGENAFWYCSSLPAISIPSGVTNIGSLAFGACSSLSAITVDPLNPAYCSVGGVLFDHGQTTLMQAPGRVSGSYTVPDSVTNVADCAFYDCASLTSVTLPNSVTSLGPNAFCWCTALTNVAISLAGSQLATIQSSAFADCVSLASINLPNSVTDLGQSAFWGCTRLTAITLPDSLTTIEPQTFSGCSGLASITLPNSLTDLGFLTFSGCYSLTNVTLPNRLRNIEQQAFYGCSGLTSITLPSSVTNLGTGAFGECPSLAAINVDTLNPAICSAGGVVYDRSQTTLLAYPPGRTGSYTIPNGVTVVGNGAFTDCCGLTNVALPDSLTNIGDGAFVGCYTLTNVTVPSGVTGIGNSAFWACTGLASVSLPNSVTIMGEYAFGYCRRLSNFIIPNSVTDIEDYVFYLCSGLTNLLVPDSVTNIESHAFYGCASLTNVTLGSGVSSLADEAFGGCPNLQAVYFPGNAPNLGPSVFDANTCATAYYVPGTTGWGSSFGGLPTATWRGVPPSITQEPQGAAAAPGQPVRFSVTASGAGLAYAWFFDGAPIAGATTSAYSITNVQVSNAGAYWVVVTNLSGSATSDTTQLTVEVPHAAAGTALVMNGFVVQVTVTDGGWGYTNPPLVEIVGGGGSGAQAVAVLANGQIVAIDILDAGFGYTDIPQILIAPPFIPPATLGLVPLTLLTFTNLTPGLDYQLQTFNSSTWFNRGTSFTAANSGFTQMVSGTIAPNGWRLALTPVPTQAQAVAQVFNGFVIGATVTSGGSGYTTNPAVTIVSNGAGSNATATATVANGAVAAVHIQHAGNGYTVSPSILIGPPPVVALSPTVTQVMELELGNLSSWGSYQLQFAPAPGGPWIDLGGPFTCNTIATTLSVNVSGNAGFFRVNHLP